MFWEKFINLCNQKGISANAVCADLGLSNATATKWKNGSIPRATTLKKIADYFGTTVSYLTGEQASRVELDLQRFAEKEKEPTNMEALEKLMEDMTEQELLDLNRKLAEVLSRKKG